MLKKNNDNYEVFFAVNFCAVEIFAKNGDESGLRADRCLSIRRRHAYYSNRSNVNHSLSICRMMKIYEKKCMDEAKSVEGGRAEKYIHARNGGVNF